MIKCVNGDIRMEGSTGQLLAEFTSIIRGVYKVLTDQCEMADQEAREEIAYAGRLAFMGENELKDEAMKKMDELMKNMGKHDS